METTTQTAESLRQQIAVTDEKLRKLKEQLANLEAQSVETSLRDLSVGDQASRVTNCKWPLSSEEYKRYGRQMIVPDIGIQGDFPSLYLIDFKLKMT